MKTGNKHLDYLDPFLKYIKKNEFCEYCKIQKASGVIFIKKNLKFSACPDCLKLIKKLKK